METNENVLKYSFVAKQSNPVLLEFRKKTNRLFGVLLLVCAAIFGLFAILCATSNNPSLWVCLIFGGFVAVCVGCAIYFFLTAKPTEKDENKIMCYEFYEYSVSINRENLIKNTNKNLVKCLYSDYKDRQYISKLFEFNDRFEIRVFTGTYNGVPQYKKFVLPKDVIGEEKMGEFKDAYTVKKQRSML